MGHPPRKKGQLAGPQTDAPTGNGEVQIESRWGVCLIDWKTTFKSASDKFGWVVDK